MMIAALWIASLLAWQQGTVDREQVRIGTPDGATLVGDYVDGGSAAAAVLFFPMCRADATDGWRPVAERLRSAGVSSLSISYRGSGNQEIADADAAYEYLRSRLGREARLAVAGSSCGVFKALTIASRHPGEVEAVVAFTGPHSPAHLEYIRKTAGVAILSGASASDGPAPGWARELKEASGNAASRLMLTETPGHGTDVFRANSAVANEIADWITGRLSRK